MNAVAKESAQSGSSQTERSVARLAAVQAMYQIAATGVDHKSVVQDFLAGRQGGFALTEDPDTETETPVRLSAMDRILFMDLVSTAVDRKSDIDQLIEANLSADWPEGRLELIVRSILRVAIAELLSAEDIPAKVSISEYVDLAHAFYSGPESKMVNAVLDRIARRVREKDFAAP